MILFSFISKAWVSLGTIGVRLRGGGGGGLGAAAPLEFFK